MFAFTNVHGMRKNSHFTFVEFIRKKYYFLDLTFSKNLTLCEYHIPDFKKKIKKNRKKSKSNGKSKRRMMSSKIYSLLIKPAMKIPHFFLFLFLHLNTLNFV